MKQQIYSMAMSVINISICNNGNKIMLEVKPTQDYKKPFSDAFSSGTSKPSSF